MERTKVKNFWFYVEERKPDFYTEEQYRENLIPSRFWVKFERLWKAGQAKGFKTPILVVGWEWGWFAHA